MKYTNSLRILLSVLPPLKFGLPRAIAVTKEAQDRSSPLLNVFPYSSFHFAPRHDSHSMRVTFNTRQYETTTISHAHQILNLITRAFRHLD
jgi:hypothetical protein